MCPCCSSHERETETEREREIVKYILDRVSSPDPHQERMGDTDDSLRRISLTTTLSATPPPPMTQVNTEVTHTDVYIYIMQNWIHSINASQGIPGDPCEERERESRGTCGERRPKTFEVLEDPQQAHTHTQPWASQESVNTSRSPMREGPTSTMEKRTERERESSRLFVRPQSTGEAG